jgi:hypothetical protein
VQILANFMFCFEKLYENMLIILLFHKLQFRFRFHVYYTPFTCGKRLMKFKIMFNRILIFLKFKFHNFQIVNAFKVWIIN